ncbi:relaxase MobL [Bacillus thuringiensis]|uniref:relaxase MobL n=1 Tax=Bacillus thuringiensis TaxID=1428 RepID=UPI003BF6F699
MFETYQDYMGDSEKTSAPFTEHANRLTESEKKSLKEMFKTAHRMEVYVARCHFFSNTSLEKQGIYDGENKNIG